VSEPWEVLWDRAMTALDSLKPGFKADIPWSFGGGTAMRLFYDHRDSKDIDIFVTDPSIISGLSPRLNDTTERLTQTYTEQSNFLKLRFPEGEVDFIIAGRLVTDIPFERMIVRGRSVDVERPIEVVAKKCFYRANDFTARDIFDLAVLINEEPAIVEQYQNILLGKKDELSRRFSFMQAPADAELVDRLRAEKARETVQSQIDGIAATPAFEWVKSSAIDTVLKFIEHDRNRKNRGRR
jgi:hypothetical protein